MYIYTPLHALYGAKAHIFIKSNIVLMVPTFGNIYFHFQTYHCIDILNVIYVSISISLSI